ncbi:hypothetical protein CG716_10305 [Mycolicibacterium sphagni]|uniref:Uncharacterized protein n=2 Tax=Mycolicibacterium sphagni TaxID=1786 RepID=A0A255DKR6_9MYCO|nr:hypothetical protein CG716_10305 [Mycolicibacterium sphagni]
MTPVTQAHQALPAVQLPSAAQVAQVALAGFDSPLSELIGTFNSFNQWIFSADNTTAGYTALGGLTDATGVGLAKTVLNFNSVGLIPQVVNDHAPFLTMLGLNGALTLESTMNAVTTIALIGSEAVWNLPGAFVTAAQQAVAGDISGAVATLQSAIVTPFVEAGQVALANVKYLVSDTLARSNALSQAIPALVDLVVKGTLGQASTLAGAFITVAQNVVAGISHGSVEQAWNAAVDGFFGPTGIPGTFLNLTVGAGVQVTPTSIIPSIRGEIQAVVHGIANALSQTGSTPPVPPPAATSASALRAASVQEPAAAVESGASNGSTVGGKVSSTNGKSTTGHSTSSSAKSGASHGVAGSKRSAAKSSAD